jgi:hypothetical protein
VVEFVGADDVPIGVYMNYPMHPINFYQSGVISADFPGEAAKCIEELFDNKTVAVFTQGASGDHRVYPELQRESPESGASPNGGPGTGADLPGRNRGGREPEPRGDSAGEPLAGRLCASGAGALLHYERQHGQSRVTGELRPRRGSGVQ